MTNDTEAQAEQQDNPVVELLEEIRGLLGTGQERLPKKRHPGAVAYDASGHPVDPLSDNAAKYTLAGAIARAVHNRGGNSLGLDSVHVLLGLDNLSDASVSGLDDFDDGSLGRRFDKAIAGAKGEQYDEPEEEEDAPT